MEKIAPNPPPGIFWHKNIRRPHEHYLGCRRYFITLCCPFRKPLLRDRQTALTVVSVLRQSSLDYRFAVYAYCVMPNHFHTLLIGLESSCDLLLLLAQFKTATADAYRARTNTELWQKKFYDRILRHNDNNSDVAGYIWMNPVRQGLCADPRGWEFSGDFKCDHPSVIDVSNDWLPPWRR